jgi:hypothetical protein
MTNSPEAQQENKGRSDIQRFMDEPALTPGTARLFPRKKLAGATHQRDTIALLNKRSMLPVIS